MASFYLRSHRRLAYAPWLVLPAILAVAFLTIPLVAAIVRVPWGSFWELMGSQSAQEALWLSLRTCLLATVVTVVLGVPFAMVMARTRHEWWSRLLRIVVLLPMVLPPVVAGLALLLAWGRFGLLGKYLDVLGISVGFSTIAVIIAQVFVSLPFLITSLEGALRAQGVAYEETARALGAGRSRTFFSVSLPLMFPALVSGLALSFARSLGEFGATITFAGSLEGVTRTMPLEIYLQREVNTDQALALAVVLILLAVFMLAIANIASTFPHKTVPAPSYSDDIVSSHMPELMRRVDTSAPAIEVDARVTDRSVDIDLDLTAGSATAVMGPNGSGKSTLLGLIAGTIEPTYGSVRFDRRNPRVVLLQQNPLLFPHLNVIKNVEFGLRARGEDRKSARERAAHEIELVGMSAFAQRASWQLSGGQAQRVAIARAMATDPDVVLLDEPFAGLDEYTTDRVRQGFQRRLSHAHVTTVLVTHDPVDAQYLAHDLVILRHGKIWRRYSVQEHFGGIQ
ncbi:ABC transporter permease [Arcanobacterium canis]